jgi:cell division transport system permease protein
VKPGFFFKEALRSIRANAAISVAATVTVMIAVFILGAFISSYLYVQSTVDGQKDRIDVQAYISDSATESQVEGLRKQIDALQASGTVASYIYVTKADALEIMRKRLKDPALLEGVNGNIFPASFKIKPSDPDKAQRIVDELSTGPAVSPAIDPEFGVSYGKETTKKLLSIAKFIQYGGLGLIAILMVASVLLIGNTIRLSLFARRREVEVMKLVGATNWFIRWPFIIEGILCGLVGAFISVLLLWATKKGVIDQFVNGQDTLTRDDATTIPFVLLGLILVAAGGAVGALGSGVTLRRFLRV